MFNFYLLAIMLIISGILAVPALIISKKTDAKAVFDKVAPYQGIFGIIILVLGVWVLIDSLRTMNLFFMVNFYFTWFVLFLSSLVLIVLGFILVFGLINQFVLSKNETSKEKGSQILAKLLPLQAKIGMLAIALGIVCIVLRLFILKY